MEVVVHESFMVVDSIINFISDQNSPSGFVEGIYYHFEYETGSKPLIEHVDWMVLKLLSSWWW